MLTVNLVQATGVPEHQTHQTMSLWTLLRAYVGHLSQNLKSAPALILDLLGLAGLPKKSIRTVGQLKALNAVFTPSIAMGHCISSTVHNTTVLSHQHES